MFGLLWNGLILYYMKALVPWRGQSHRLIDYMMNKQSIVSFMIETSSQTINKSPQYDVHVTTLRFPLDMDRDNHIVYL